MIMVTSRSRRSKAGIIALISLVALAAAAVVGFGIYFHTHALPGTYVGAYDIGGKTREQARKDLGNAALSQVITLEPGFASARAVTPSELGILIDVEATLDQAFGTSPIFVAWPAVIMSVRTIEPVLEVDQDVLHGFIERLESETVPDPIPAMVFDENSSSFQASTSTKRLQVEGNNLSDALVNAARSLDDTVVAADVVECDIDIEPESLASAIELANSWIATDVSVKDEDGVLAQATPVDIAQWVTFEIVDGQIRPKVDIEQVTSWLTPIAEEQGRGPMVGQKEKNSRGDIIGISGRAEAGRSVSNLEQTAQQIVDVLDRKQFAALTQSADGDLEIESPGAVSATLTYDYTEPEYDVVSVADGSGDSVYVASPGEQWIDVNLKTLRMTAYEGSVPVQTSLVIGGATKSPTKLGDYSIYFKTELQDMRGIDWDGTPYVTENVPWAMFYSGDFALHGAYWRDDFGIQPGDDGSHGCVNLPVSEAEKLYRWASEGTKVFAHN